MRWWVDFWLRHSPPGAVAGAVVVWVVTTLAIALVASVVRTFAARRVFSREFHLHRRVDEWHGRSSSDNERQPTPIPGEVLERWAFVEFRQASIWSRVGSTAERFGGWAFPSHSLPNLPSALTPYTALVATGITYFGWPDEAIARAAAWALAQRTESKFQEFLGLPIAAIVLLMTLVTLMPRTPIVDHIRARDDAARTANAHLAELTASMLAFAYSAYDWRISLMRDRRLYVRQMVEKYTDGERSWSGSSVCDPAPGFSVLTHLGHPEAPDPSFAEAYDRMSEQRRRLQASGVELVAWRLSGRSLAYLRIAGIYWSGVPEEHDLSGAYHPRQAIDAFFDDVHPLRPWMSNALDKPRLESDLTRAAANATRVLDMYIADIALAEHALYAATNYLTARMIGRWWVRAFSATQR